MRKTKQFVIIERRPMILDFLIRFFSRPELKFRSVSGYASVNEALNRENLPKNQSLFFLVGGNELVFIEQSVEDIRRHCPKASIMVLDNSVRQPMMQMIKNRQIEAYFTLQDTPNDVLEGIEHVSRGEQVVLTHDDPNHTENDGPSYSRLSKRERQLLRLLVNGHDLYECSSQMKITVKSVENLKGRLMQKVEVHTSNDLILVGVDFGLKEY